MVCGGFSLLSPVGATGGSPWGGGWPTHLRILAFFHHQTAPLHVIPRPREGSPAPLPKSTSICTPLPAVPPWQTNYQKFASAFLVMSIKPGGRVGLILFPEGLGRALFPPLLLPCRGAPSGYPAPHSPPSSPPPTRNPLLPSTELKADVDAAHPSRPFFLSFFPPSTKLEGSACALAQALPSVFSSPSPLQALRACPESLEGERGIKRVRVPLGGLGGIPPKTRAQKPLTSITPVLNRFTVRTDIQ